MLSRPNRLLIRRFKDGPDRCAVVLVSLVPTAMVDLALQCGPTRTISTSDVSGSGNFYGKS